MAETDGSGVRLVHSGENFHQGGLPRAVVADQGDDLTREDVEVDIGEGGDGAEGFADPTQREQRAS